MRAVGIVRQSRGREESLSPAQQRDRIAAHCEREGWELLAVHEEIDVSGGMPLDRREGLRAAVEAIENGEASVVVVAYFDRLFRSLRVQGEVVARIEAAGGELLARVLTSHDRASRSRSIRSSSSSEQRHGARERR